MPTVLIADDDADHLELMSLALERAGHTVIRAPDAESARAALAGGGIDAALLDVRMPGESGIELCRRLRSEPATAFLPIMVISADVNDQRIRHALDAGADDYLFKPFQREALCARLSSLLRPRPGVSRPPAAVAAAALKSPRKTWSGTQRLTVN
ncbi:response regulator transcription factor [Paractinoplanes atraurantiacus]|uniref:Two-component system, OmpR family, phosphate regulon response regulator PhoB n=1 Tax=Paractinoplanes atraurantiacus TaxID=1036182 RepID=A0A285KK68_9ACTN|nr:response regulator [Actinoplanes atraurantiacus]SNY72613.1 two-component system, OmpR family, phosphate regulon response regulator PhoB [Actinoplanes atraurantiacus]